MTDREIVEQLIAKVIKSIIVICGLAFATITIICIIAMACVSNQSNQVTEIYEDIQELNEFISTEYNYPIE